ncbi:MAG: PHP domain-containing protein, partial [Roseiflexaceae bacterium]
YRRASQALQAVELPLYELHQRNRIHKIDGLSKGMAEKVAELFVTGDIEYYSRLQERMPVGVRELLRVPHIGPRTAGRLYNELGIAGLADLQRALDAGHLQSIKGIGARTLAGIREGITAVADREERTLLLHAWQVGLQLLAEIRTLPTVIDASWAGSLRRGMSTVGDLDVVVASSDPVACVQMLAQSVLLMRAQVHSSAMAAVLPNGMNVEIIVVTPDMWGVALAMYTGSRAHRDWVLQRAQQRGLVIRDYALWQQGAMQAVPSEVEFYQRIDLPWIAPELRDRIVDEASLSLPPALLTRADMTSDLHMHTTWSDGRGSVAQMAEAARQHGYTHIAITDHGALIGITNGLDTKRLRQQRLEIEVVNTQYRAAGVDFHLLHGVEVDILVDGSLALPDAVLHELDIVVASPHIHLRQPAEVATNRLINAIMHPAVDIIGHPRGRIIGGRLGAPVDMPAVSAAAVAHGVALEVNSGPDRLDIDGELVYDHVRDGGLITVNSDAHDIDNLAWIEQGVATARRGGVAPAQVLNTWSRADLLTFLRRSRM